jgi:hypothetical protein
MVTSAPQPQKTCDHQQDLEPELRLGDQCGDFGPASNHWVNIVPQQFSLKSGWREAMYDQPKGTYQGNAESGPQDDGKLSTKLAR